MKTVLTIAILLTVLFSVHAQKNDVSKVWVADNGDGTYKNPVLGAKVGIFCTRETEINDSGYADFDWFRVGPIQ